MSESKSLNLYLIIEEALPSEPAQCLTRLGPAGDPVVIASVHTSMEHQLWEVHHTPDGHLVIGVPPLLIPSSTYLTYASQPHPKLKSHIETKVFRTLPGDPKPTEWTHVNGFLYPAGANPEDLAIGFIQLSLILGLVPVKDGPHGPPLKFKFVKVDKSHFT